MQLPENDGFAFVVLEKALFGAFPKLFEQLFLLFRELGWGVYNNRDDVCAARIALEVWYAMTGQLEICATLSAGWNFHTNFAVNRLDVDFGTERGFDYTDMFFAEYEITLAGKFLVWFDAQMYV